MGSTYNGDGSTFNSSLTLPVGSDLKTVQTVRTPMQGLLDNDVNLHNRLTVEENPAPFFDEVNTTVTDTSAFCGAASLGDGYPMVVAKAGESWEIGDYPTANAGGATNIVADLKDIATDGATLVAIRNGGAATGDYSTDNGASWTATAAMGFNAEHIVWNEDGGVWIIANASASARSADPTASWTAGAAPSEPVLSGLACLSSGRVVGVCYNSGVTFTVSDDYGASWSDASGTVTDDTDPPEGGSIAGNNGTYVYHFARYAVAPDTWRVSRSDDGETWETLATFAMPHSGASPGGSQNRILMCQNTGLLVVGYRVQPNLGDEYVAVRYSKDLGANWSEPAILVGTTQVTGLAVAQGRIIYADATPDLFVTRQLKV